MQRSASSSYFNAIFQSPLLKPIKISTKETLSLTSKSSLKTTDDSSQNTYIYPKMSEQKQRYDIARHKFLIKARAKIMEYSEGIGSTRQMITKTIKGMVGTRISFFNQIDAKYKIKYQRCFRVYHKTLKESDAAATTRGELLQSLSALIHTLNIPTGGSCSTGFDLIDEALTEANLLPLGPIDEVFLKKTTPRGEEEGGDESLYPIII